MNALFAALISAGLPVVIRALVEILTNKSVVDALVSAAYPTETGCTNCQGSITAPTLPKGNPPGNP